MIIPNDIFFDEVTRLIGQGEAVTITVRGTSMTPFLRNGRDRVVLAPFEDEDLVRGAIVLFRYGDRHLLHRIVHRNGQNIEIQGDALFTTERATVADAVAVVKAIVRPNNHIVRNGSVSWRLSCLVSSLHNSPRRLLYAIRSMIVKRA
ncbi:MAG: S24/S26 family peptidase [Rikenellaceae bacterium]|jgi:signal peptidase I|nr:S24/S26 family peptidase [Rikenellaceae bacterium]